MVVLHYKKISLEELIPLAQKGDMKALEEIIKREQKNVFATFSYLCKKKENVADLTQEALFRLAKNINNLKQVKNFKSWLNQIITNLFYDELRKSQRRPEAISMDENEKTSIDDIVMVCSNCHSMIHRKKPWLTIDKIKEILEN